MQLRRPRSLVITWQQGELTLENYLEPKSTDSELPNALAVDVAAVELLDRFEDWSDPEHVVADHVDHDPASVRDAIQALADEGLLLAREDAVADDALESEWGRWSEEARYFHFATKDTIYIADDDDYLAKSAELVAASEPPPPIFKTDHGATRVYLPRVHETPQADFTDVLTARRTHRRFTEEPVSIEALSTLLHYSFAPMHYIDGGRFGTLILKTSPCAGARHELECYVAAMHVAGLPPGIYHYCPESHSLEVVAANVTRDEIDRLCFSQPHCREAPFVCFMTAVFARAMYKYRHPRQYRAVLLDAGHVAQTFALTATALGLGPFQTAAFRDTEVERALGLDGFSEGALYVLGAGHPAPSSGALPAEFEHGHARPA